MNDFEIQWSPSWRLVPSRFPPVGPFDRVADPKDLAIVLAIENMTNDRLREEVGDLSLVPEKYRISGPCTTPIMAAFTHPNPDGSRFADGAYGVYYASNNIDTAIKETVYHRERFLKATNEDPIHIDMRSYASDIKAELCDIRGKQNILSEIYDPNSYVASQAFARELRMKDSNGIVYDSIRDTNGECIAVFKPCLLKPVVQGSHYCYVWDGSCISDVYIKKEYGVND